MTFATLNTTTNKVSSRSSVRPAGKPSSPNIRTNPLTAPELVKCHHVENYDTELPSNHPEENNEPSKADYYTSLDSFNQLPKNTMP